MTDKLPPHIRAQIEAFKQKADHNEALSKEYRDHYSKVHTPNQPTYEEWLKIKGYQKMAEGGVIENAPSWVPKSWTYEGRMKDRIFDPSKKFAKGGDVSLQDMRNYILQREGTHGARRLERATDEIPNLEKMYHPNALKSAFSGDNTRVVATIHPKDFERYAMPLPMNLAVNKAYHSDKAVRPTMRQAFMDSGLTDQQWQELNDYQRADLFDKYNAKISKMKSNRPMTYDQYIKHLAKIKGGFAQVPFLQLDKQEQGLPIVPHITGHEGRHRNRALFHKGVDKSLVTLEPRAELREGFPRRERDEYLDALKKEMAMTNNMVRPEDEEEYGKSQIIRHKRPPIQLPDFYAEGGDVQGKPMNTPSIAQMKAQLGKQSNPNLMSNVGINESLDMSPKVFMNPNPHSQGIPDIGGVQTHGGLPIGGIDMNNQEAGQQLMPQGGFQPQQPQQQDQQQGQTAPSGPTPPMGNMLSLTQQGQQMGAMQPPAQPPQMASGGAMRLALLAKGGSAGEEKRIVFNGHGHGGVKGISVPKHMWEGGKKAQGMKHINKARAEIYGAENRDPLTIGQIGKIHKEHLSNHFQKPIEEQIAHEKEAIARLRKAQHLGSTANTLDESEKLDTVRHERDPQGRGYVGYASKGVAGHSLYTSGHGEHQKHHVINTCPGQTVGCGGGVDKNGIVDTSKGTCFAPNAESQYVNAAVRRATHEQSKHDPKMTMDWILAHAGSLREASNSADKKNLVTLFRPNVVDETDVSSRHVLRHLNEQRRKEGKPDIIANSYGKTNELHDPENGYYVTHSNVGPKTKHGHSINENIGRDKARVRNTIMASDNKGDFRNEQGNKTPPKNSYMVTDVKRGSDFDKEMQKAIKYAKYWSAPRHKDELSHMERDEGNQSHYDSKGNLTTPDKAHYGHMMINDRRYDYQKQHILHPRFVQVGHNPDGTPHMIPTDSRFKDDEFLPKNRFKTKNGKVAGAILMTTPTTSTSNHLHHSSFTHHVNDEHLEHARKNNGEYEIDPPHLQEMSMGKEYVPPQPIKIVKKAIGGSVGEVPMTEDYKAFPEQNFMGQMHNAQTYGLESIHDLPSEMVQKRLTNG
jgi:hypothetical protein